LSGVAWPGLDFSGRAGELNTASIAVEVVRTIIISPEAQWFSFNDGVALLAHVLAHALSLHLGVARVAEGPALVLHEALVSQLLRAHLTREALKGYVDTLKSLSFGYFNIMIIDYIITINDVSRYKLISCSNILILF